MVRAPLAILVLTVVSILPVPSVSADSFCGDAPGAWAPCDIPYGNHQGTIGDTDTVDLYRVFVPAGMGVGVEFSIVNEPHVHAILYHEGDMGGYQDQHVSPGCCWGPQDPNAHWGGGVASFADGLVTFGLELRDPTPNTYTYDFKVYLAQLNDLAVSAPEVEGIPLQTDLGDGPAGTLRRISFTISNLEDTGDQGAGYNVQAYTPSDGRWHAIGGGGFQVTPGMTSSFSVDWQTLGYLADVQIHVNVGNPFETHGDNNNGMVSTFVGVGGTGFGASPLARDNGGVGVDSCRGVGGGSLGLPGANACLSAGTQPNGGVDAHVGANAGETNANVNANYNPWWGGNLDACYFNGTVGGGCYNQGLP